ncbi:hypothetical protein FM113_16600 [Leucobacter sp. 7(1)]|nr:hypothetical protein FM113_16600 [Leucobacter sp. 7(1)]
MFLSPHDFTSSLEMPFIKVQRGAKEDKTAGVNTEPTRHHFKE